MRVGLLIAHFFPNASGAEIQAEAQGIELARLGCAVHVLTSRVAGLPPLERRDGLIIHRVIHAEGRGPLFGPLFVRSAAKALARLRDDLDIVHTHQGLWEAIAAGWARRVGALRGLPVLVQPASSGAFGEAESLMRLKGARLWRSLTLANSAFAAISRDIADQWLALGVPPERMHATRSGVDSGRFHPGPSEVEASLPPRPRVIFTGRLHPQKNLDVLLNAWRDVVAARPVHLLLAGDGPERPRLQRRAEEEGMTPFVHFLGRLANPATHLRGADLFALPSVAEGMSNSLLEAMASGLPALASRIGGNVDLVEEGVTGHLIAADDPNAWARAVLDLVNDPGRRSKMGEDARRVIERDYALDRVVEHNLRLYETLIGARRSRKDG